MEKNIKIKMISKINGIPIYTTKRVYEGLIQTSEDYSGYEDKTKRIIKISNKINEKIKNIENNEEIKFSITLEDLDYSGDPDKIEKTRHSISVKNIGGKIIVDFDIRNIKITKEEEERIIKIANKEYINYYSRNLI